MAVKEHASWSSRSRSLPDGSVVRYFERAKPGAPGCVERVYPQGSEERCSPLTGTAQMVALGQVLPRRRRSVGVGATAVATAKVLMIPGAFEQLWDNPLTEKRELAGGLFGWVREGTITIREVALAVKNSTRTSCEIDAALIDQRLAEHRAADDGLVLVGTFHTEPSVGEGAPSKEDLRHWRSWANAHGAPHFAGVTVRRPARWFLGWRGADVRARVFTRTPSGVLEHADVQRLEPKGYLL